MQQTPGTPDKDFFSFFTGFTQTAAETISGSILPGAKQVLNVFQQIDSEAVKVAKSFGQGRENVLSIKQILVDAAPAVEALGGSFEDVGKIQMALTDTLKRNVLLSSESFEKLYATQEVTGKKVAELLPAFKNVGISAYGVAEGMQKIVDVARQQGLSVAAVSQQAVDNMESMNKYTFQGGVDGLAKMAAQATSLRIDMKTSLNFAENLYNPEKAIEMSAALQRLGVTQTELLDPLRLVDLSINNPTELQNQLVQMTQQFVSMNKAGQFEIAPQGKLQLREIASATGIAYEELTKMALGSAELEGKLSKIRFPDFMSEDQQKMVANLAEMKDGEYVITVGNETMSLADALSNIDNSEELDKLIKASEPKTMEDMAKEQLDIQKSMMADVQKIANRTARGLASSRAGESTGDAVREVTKGFTDIITDRDVLSSKSIRGVADTELGQMGDILSKMLEGNTDVSANLLTMGDTLTEFGQTTLNGLSENFKEQYAKMTESNNAYAKASTSVLDGLNNFVKSQTGVDLLGKISTPADASVNKSTDAGKTDLGKSEEKTINTSSTVDVNIKIEVPPGVTEKDVMSALNTEQIQQKIVEIATTRHSDLNTKPGQ